LCPLPRGGGIGAIAGIKKSEKGASGGVMCELKPFFVVNPLVSGHLIPAELPRRMPVERMLYAVGHEIFVCELAAGAPDYFGPEIALFLEGLYIPDDSRDLAAMMMVRLAKSHVELRLRRGRRIVLCGLHRDRLQRLRVEVRVNGEDLCADAAMMLETALGG